MGILTEEAERSVVNRAKKGDRDAMKQIYDCYSRYLAATCSRFLSDGDALKDVLQDSFVKIFTSIGSFDYRGQGSLKAWMRQIAVNEVLKLLRKRRRGDTVDYTRELPDTVEDEVDEKNVAEIPAPVIQNMIKSLPEGYRTVLNLYVFEEKSHREIASLLGIAENTSASQLHRARALLARQITEYKKNIAKG